MKNALFEAEVEADPGHLTIRIRACNQDGPHARQRKIAAFLYELAAELERKAEEKGAGWVITPQPSEHRVILDLGLEEGSACAAIEEVLGVMGLA